MKFKCEKDHLIDINLPENYYKDGVVIECPRCKMRYEIESKNGQCYVKPYRHPDPLRFIAMHY